MVPFVRELGESGWSLRPLDQWSALGSRSLLRGSLLVFLRTLKKKINDRSISDDRAHDPKRRRHRGGSRVHRLRQRARRRDRGIDPWLQSALVLRFRHPGRLPAAIRGLPRFDSSVSRRLELRHGGGSAFCRDSNETDATRHRLRDSSENEGTVHAAADF